MTDMKVTWDPSEADIAISHAPVTQMNKDQIGSEAPHMVTVNAYDNGRAIGGIYGYVQYGWFNALSLWVNPQERRQGLAGCLLREMEGIAEAKGLIGIRLSTTDFGGGPKLYDKAGYELVQVWNNRSGRCNGGTWREIVYAKWLDGEGRDNDTGVGQRDCLACS